MVGNVRQSRSVRRQRESARIHQRAFGSAGQRKRSTGLRFLRMDAVPSQKGFWQRIGREGIRNPTNLRKEQIVNTEKFQELESESSENLATKFKAMQEHAEHIIREKTQQMISDGRAFELSEDEERMLKAYRGFKNRSAPGSVFSWCSLFSRK